MTHTKDQNFKRASSALAGGLMIAGVYVGLTSTKSLLGAIANTAPFIVVAEGVRRQTKSSYPTCLISFVDEVGLGCAEFTQGTSKSAIAHVKPKKVATDLLSRMPLGDQIASRLFSSGELSTKLFDQLEHKSSYLCGQSGDGKTYLMNYLLGKFLMANEGNDHDVVILDQDYGRSHDGSDPNTWYDLPLGSVVFKEPSQILQKLRDINDFVDTAEGNDHKPQLVIFDEFSRTVSSSKFDQKEKEEIIEILTNIADRGLKVNVRIILGAQTLAVGKNGLPTDLLNRLIVLLLHSSAQVDRNYRNIDVDSDQKETVINKMKSLSKVVENPVATNERDSEVRPCVFYDNGKLSTGAIPKIDISKIELVERDELTPQQELERDWSEKSFSNQVQLLVELAIAQNKDPMKCLLSKAWDLFGGNSSQRSNDNPYYVAFRERLGKEIKNLLTKK